MRACAPASVSVGVDLVAIADVEASVDRFGARYLTRLFTPAEIADTASPDPGTTAAGLAARFAVKEAVLKILRVGSDIPAWSDIEVRRGAEGASTLALAGTARRLAEEAGLHRWSVSLSHEGAMAAAVVLAEAPPSPRIGSEHDERHNPPSP